MPNNSNSISSSSSSSSGNSGRSNVGRIASGEYHLCWLLTLLDRLGLIRDQVWTKSKFDYVSRINYVNRLLSRQYLALKKAL